MGLRPQSAWSKASSAELSGRKNAILKSGLKNQGNAPAFCIACTCAGTPSEIV